MEARDFPRAPLWKLPPPIQLQALNREYRRSVSPYLMRRRSGRGEIPSVMGRGVVARYCFGAAQTCFGRRVGHSCRSGAASANVAR